MPRNMSKERIEVLELLRSSGEVPYEKFVEDLRKQGKYEHIAVLPQLYVAHQTEQRLVKNDAGKLILMIKAGE